jgi:hypothetical protein
MSVHPVTFHFAFGVKRFRLSARHFSLRAAKKSNRAAWGPSCIAVRRAAARWDI